MASMINVCFSAMWRPLFEQAKTGDTAKSIKLLHAFFLAQLCVALSAQEVRCNSNADKSKHPGEVYAHFVCMFSLRG
jgi:hypothetical protein